MPPKKNGKSNRQTSKMFPAAGAAAGVTGPVVPIRAPKIPPQINTVPAFRRTIRYQAAPVNSGSTNAISPVVIWNQDSLDYGLSSGTFRWQSFYLHGVRLYATLVTSTTASCIFAASVPDLSDLTQGPSIVLRDNATLSDPAVIAWRWSPTNQRRIFLTDSTGTIFTLINSSSVTMNVCMDIDVTFAG